MTSCILLCAAQHFCNAHWTILCMKFLTSARWIHHWHRKGDSCSKQYIIFSRVCREEIFPSKCLSFVSLPELLEYWQNAADFQCEPMESLKQLWNTCKLFLSVSTSSFICSLGVVFNSWDGLVVAVLESELLNPFTYRVCQMQVMEQWAVFLVHKPVLSYTGENWLGGCMRTDYLLAASCGYFWHAWNLSVSPEKLWKQLWYEYQMLSSAFIFIESIYFKKDKFIWTGSKVHGS